MASVEQFADFELHELIGEGGMAEVWRARFSPGFQRSGWPHTFALKRVLADVVNDPIARDSFLTEADVAPLVRHRNIVRFYDSGVHEDRGWIGMELVDGEDLEVILDRHPGEPLDPAVGCTIVSQLLQGIEGLHNATGRAGTPLGLVHRDVTPGNVLVSRHGEVKLADLGVARAIGFDAQDPGSVKGKLRYLSPEQVVGGDLGPPTDVFAAGVILFELLTGRTAFDQEGEEAVMIAIRDGKVPRLKKVAPSLPRALDHVVHDALHYKTHKRFQTAAEFGEALEAVREAEGWMMRASGLARALEAWAL